MAKAVETLRKRRSHRGPSATTIATMGDVGRSIDAELRELQQRWCALHRWPRMTAAALVLLSNGGRHDGVVMLVCIAA
jgi:hypothetical protein